MASIIAKLVQRRREAQEAEAKDSEWVAVPAEGATEEVELLEVLAE